MLKKFLFLFSIVIISGLSGIIAEKYLFPRLASSDFFSRYKFFQKSVENVTVINKTEQVYIKEDSSVRKISDSVASSVVGIIPISSQLDEKTISFKKGTGVIVTSDGIIMTFASAVGLDTLDIDKAKEKITKKYKVVIAGNNVYEAEFLGMDSWSNLVFFKINASNLPAISFGNSADYKPGEKIIMLGESFSQEEKCFSSGLLNGINPIYNISEKSLAVAEKLEGVFEVDFPKSENFLGAPAVDYSGQTLGILGETEKNGKKEFFLIPSQKVKLVIDKVIAKKMEENPQLGIYYISLSKDYAISNELKNENGALIFSPSGQQGLAILEGTPAQKAGLKLGDIIVKVGETIIDLQNNLSGILYQYRKGDQVEFTVLRNDAEMKIMVIL